MTDRASDDAADAAGADGTPEADASEDGEASTAERFRRRIRELEDRLESSTDDAEREALRRDLEHLRDGLRSVEGPEDGAGS